MLNLKDRAQDTSASAVLLPVVVPKVSGSVLGYGLLGRSQQWVSGTDVYCAPGHRSYSKPWSIFCNVLPQVSYSSVSHFLQAFVHISPSQEGLPYLFYLYFDFHTSHLLSLRYLLSPSGILCLFIYYLSLGVECKIYKKRAFFFSVHCCISGD